MSEMQTLCCALAGTKEEAAALHRQLRWFGCRGSVHGLAAHLRFLVRLDESFARLASEYPRLAGACALLRDARVLLVRLNQLRSAGAPPAVNLPQPDPAFTQALDAAFAEPGADCTLAVGLEAADVGVVALTMVAAAHLLVRVWTGHLRAPPHCARVIARLSDLDDLPDLTPVADTDLAGLHAQPTVAAICRSLMSPASTPVPQAGPAESRTPVFLSTELASFAQLLSDTDAREVYAPRLVQTVQPQRLTSSREEDEADGDGDAKPVREWGNRGSQLLLDRELLPEANYGLSARDASALAASFCAAPAWPKDRIVTRGELLRASGGFLAFGGGLTASSIAEAAAIPVEMVNAGAPADHLLRPGGRQLIVQRGRREVMTWWPTQGPGGQLALEVDGLELDLAAFHRSLVLDELLPLPISEIRIAVLKRIGKLIQRTQHQADLCVKHLLARQVFSMTGNRGIVAHLCTTFRPQRPKSDAADSGEPIDGVEDDELEGEDEGEERGGDGPEQAQVRRESLSNYIHPQSAAVLYAYRSACRAIRFPELAADDAAQKPRLACQGKTWVPAERLAKVIGFMARAALDRSGKTVIQHHNDFVLYVATLLVVALGYRRCRGILPFIHDLNLEDGLAFIADKMREGSEARFVPLVDDLLRQIKAYRAHVMFVLAELGKTNPALSKRIAVAVGLAPRDDSQASVRHTGPFFRIRGGRAVPVTTAAVDWALREAASALGVGHEPPMHTRLLRRNFASWLADEGVSGSHIEMLLGHLRELHPFGPASVWVPKQELSSMREPMARYFAEMGCKYIGAPWAKPFSGRFTAPLPSFETSSLAYEGRKLEADEARLRARKCILEIVPEDVLLDDQAVDLTQADLDRIEKSIRTSYSSSEAEAEDIVAKLREMASTWRHDASYAVPRAELLRPVAALNDADPDEDHERNPLNAIRQAAHRVLSKAQIRGQRVLLLDDETVAKLSDQIDVELREDPAARAKVMVAFGELAAGWRRTGQYRVTAASINLARFAPGPVDVRFARHLALAQAVTADLPDRIEGFLSKTSTAKAMLGVVAVLLVSCDAVLDRVELFELLQVLQLEGLARFEGQLQLRASMAAKDAEYDRTADLTYKTAAAVLGFLHRRQGSEQFAAQEIEAEANAFLRHVTLPLGSMNLSRLLAVMRPYWYLRMPGSVFATISGQQECNAPSQRSMALLLGAPVPELHLAPPAPRGLKERRDADIAAALAAVADLVADAEGRIPDFEGASRQQRLRLRQAFSDRHRPSLQTWMNRVPVVALAVQFVYYMLEVGGFKVQTYKFESLQTYRRRVLPPIFEVAWQLDLLALDANGLVDFFRAVLDRVDDAQRHAAKAPLRLFLRFLHQWHGAPHTRYEAHTEPRPRRARNVVLPALIAEQAVKVASRPDEKTSRVAKAGATLLGVNHAFGLRSREGYGLKVLDFLDQERTSVRVRINVIRSLKTFQRTVPISLASETSTALLEERAAAAGQRGKETKNSLFADEDRDALYDDVQLLALGNWAVKHASGDQDAIVYSLRHSFATSVMSHMLVQAPVAAPIAAQVGAALRLPSTAQQQLKALRPGADRWPQQIDRLGAWMGHRGTGTLSRTYWHGAWWSAAEFCCREALASPWKSEVLGLLLGVSGAAVRARFGKLNDDQRGTVGERSAQAIAQGVRASMVPSLSPQLSAEPCAPDTDGSAGPRPVVSVLDALLMRRRFGTEEFENLAPVAARRLNVPLQEAKAFFDAYAVVAGMTRFHDFEPSETRPEWLARIDIEAGADRRDVLVTWVLERAAVDKNFAKEARELLADWQQEVDGEAEAPCLVSRSLDQLQRHVKWLQQVGYDLTGLRLSCFAAPNHYFEACAEVVPNPRVSTQRFSRAARIGQRTEFGLSVEACRRLPAARDLHLALLALACALRADLLAAD